jgi:hypothetical protein
MGLNTTIYIVEPQASHQRMPILRIETQLAQYDSHSNHSLIFEYL